MHLQTHKYNGFIQRQSYTSAFEHDAFSNQIVSLNHYTNSTEYFPFFYH